MKTNPSIEPTFADASRGGAGAAHAVHAIALGELEPPAPQAGADLAVADRESPLHRVKARLSVRVGEVTVTLGELLAAREHQVLVLDRALDQPVEMLLEGHVVARGQLVAVDDQFAVRITELPVALRP